MNNSASQQDKIVTFCKVSTENTDDWAHGIIYYVNNKKNTVEVFLTASNLKTRFDEKSRVVIKSLNDDNELLITGTIIKKSININKQSIVVKVDSSKAYSNNREHERFFVNYAASINTSDGVKHPAVLLDISLGGTMLFSNSSLESDSNASFEIFITPKNKLVFHGKIMRKIPVKDGFDYGIRIETIDDENFIILKEVIEFLMIQKNHVAHELKVFRRIRRLVYTVTVILILFLVFGVLSNSAG